MGRFAPSPTGPLHLGSLYTALASFLHARHQNGLWRLRIDDLDTPRTVNGAANHILHTLDHFGLHWDGAVVYQSQQLELYQDALADLTRQQLLYPCCCSRKDLITTIYSQTCRGRFVDTTQPHALRIKTDSRAIHFSDALQGEMSENLATQHGDFILKRKDGIIAYQFAVVLDDKYQNVTDVVRGVDLLDSTPKQIYLHHCLEIDTPSYMHLPIIIDENGDKLSKQTRATAVDTSNPPAMLFRLLQLLKQQPPAVLQQASTSELLHWAIAHWHYEPLKNNRTIAGF